MTCQFTLFNSIPTATKPTDADVKDKVDGVCAVSLMTEDTCKSLPSTLLINNPKYQCLFNSATQHPMECFHSPGFAINSAAVQHKNFEYWARTYGYDFARYVWRTGMYAIFR
jgi:hypothetical protein